MLDSIYVGQTGLMEYAKGLNNISNNVANLNTAGFKSSELQFTDLFYQYQSYGGGSNSGGYAQGSGVAAGDSTIIFKQGELRSTGNDQDVAIDGQGLFILRKDGQTFYTRAGQFSFDDNGYLIARDSGARVAGLTAGNGLRDINISGYRSSPAKTTTLVKFSDSLSTSDTSFDITDLKLIDSLGASHALSLHFVNNNLVTSGSWTIQVKDGGTVISTGEIRYLTNGSTLPGFDTHILSFNPANGAAPMTVTLDFSSTNNFSSAASTIKVASGDGYAAGSLTSATFDEAGNLVLSYSNGQTAKNDRLAMAWFSDMQALDRVGGTVMRNTSDQKVVIGGAGDDMFGSVKGGSIEMSNVDLAQQFSELITTQRGYQASSQIISAANEMMQQLLDLKGKR